MLRLLEIRLPATQADVMRGLLDELTPEGHDDEITAEGRVVVRVVLHAERAGPVVDAITNRFESIEGFQLLILPVEAIVPRLPEPEPELEDEETQGDEPEKEPQTATGVSREELYAKTIDMAKLSRTFIATVVLSTVVAAVGIHRDSIAVIIGAMVIAPLLGPNVALALATTLGDMKLMKTALRSILVGLSTALLLTVVLGLVLPIDSSGHEVVARTEVYLSDIVLSLASGIAGVLALTSGLSSALVGVMVAVALLPPTVVLGLMLGSGDWDLAGKAALLLLTNIICVNLAGVVTFVLQGVRPRIWWETDRARRSARIALAIWAVLLIVLVALIIVSQGEG